MATPTGVSWIDRGLRLLAADLADLPEIAEQWDTTSEGNRVSYSIEWWDLMLGFRDLHEAHQLGQMTAVQVEKYRDVSRLLQKYLPIIRCLGIAEPPVPLDGAA